MKTYADGYFQAQQDLQSGIAHMYDPGYQPPMNDYQRGYNDCIQAPSGPGVIGTGLVILIGISICAALYFVLKLSGG